MRLLRLERSACPYSRQPARYRRTKHRSMRVLQWTEVRFYRPTLAWPEWSARVAGGNAPRSRRRMTIRGDPRMPSPGRQHHVSHEYGVISSSVRRRSLTNPQQDQGLFVVLTTKPQSRCHFSDISTVFCALQSYLEFRATISHGFCSGGNIS